VIHKGIQQMEESWEGELIATGCCGCQQFIWALRGIRQIHAWKIHLGCYT